MDWKKYLSRKFLLSVAGFVGGTLALFSGHMTGGEYALLLSGLVGLYGAGNVGFHATQRLGPKT